VKTFIFNAFVNREPVQTSKNGCDVRKFDSLTTLRAREF